MFVSKTLFYCATNRFLNAAVIMKTVLFLSQDPGSKFIKVYVEQVLHFCIRTASLHKKLLFA